MRRRSEAGLSLQKAERPETGNCNAITDFEFIRLIIIIIIIRNSNQKSMVLWIYHNKKAKNNC